MLKRTREWLNRICCPFLDWVQVEVSTDCNAACVYCPNTVSEGGWTPAHMSLEMFSNFLPYLKHAELIHLQGWGEPLLNPAILDMIRLCKGRGHRVSLTTNGMLLDREIASRLVELRLDILGVSLAGTEAHTHNDIRKGTDLETVVANMEMLRSIKAEAGVDIPAVHLAYLMLVSNYRELEQVVPLAERVGARQVVVSNLAHIPDTALAREAVFNDPDASLACCEILERVHEDANAREIIFDYHLPVIDRSSVQCRENVVRSCVITVDGDISPCVFASPVLTGKEPSCSISFGNLRHRDFTSIWEDRSYRTFRELFSPEALLNPKQSIINLPTVCKNCYKRLGV